MVIYAKTISTLRVTRAMRGKMCRIAMSCNSCETVAQAPSATTMS